MNKIMALLIIIWPLSLYTMNQWVFDMRQREQALRQQILINYITNNDVENARQAALYADIYLPDKFGVRPIDYAVKNPYMVFVLQQPKNQSVSY